MLKVLQISDLHIFADPTQTLMGVNTADTFQAVLAAAFATHQQFDLILVTGDLAQQAVPASYQRIKEILRAYQTQTLCLPGNHDDFSLMQAILTDNWLSCQPYTRLANWQIICINSQKPGSPIGEISNQQLAFLSDTLIANPTTPTLLAMHHHCVSSGSPWMDTMQITNSAALLTVLAGFPQVKLVCFGHIHQELVIQHPTRSFFAAPASCFQFQTPTTALAITEQPPGYRVFELFADGGFSSTCHWLATMASSSTDNS